MRALLCVVAACASAAPVEPGTTAGAIALANLDVLIAQQGAQPGGEDLLLARSRFLGDYDALDRAVVAAERRSGTAAELLRRARARSAVHRFADALADAAAAERAGADRAAVTALQGSILVATGRASEVIPRLETEVWLHPGYPSRSALAVAYAAVGRSADADRLYAAALANLDTTSPFPYAWIEFARGGMWAEQAGDPARGEAHYRRALAYLPQFAAANIHLAELEAARGDRTSAIARLERVVASSDEPEARGLLGTLEVQAGDRDRGARDLAQARARFEELLRRYPLAFADHAAELYLGAGADPERAWTLAYQNLANRPTPRAFALALRAARATGRDREAIALMTGAEPLLP